MADTDDKVIRVEPVRGMKTAAVRPYGIESRMPEARPPARRKKKQPDADSSCTITTDKVDCKI